MTAEVTSIKTAAETGLAEAFAALRGTLADGAVAARREAAFRRFETQGLPHRHVEEWKYTDLRVLMRDAKPLAGVPDTAATALRMAALSSFLQSNFGLRVASAQRCQPPASVPACLPAAIIASATLRRSSNASLPESPAGNSAVIPGSESSERPSHPAPQLAITISGGSS